MAAGRLAPACGSAEEGAVQRREQGALVTDWGGGCCACASVASAAEPAVAVHANTQSGGAVASTAGWNWRSGLVHWTASCTDLGGGLGGGGRGLQQHTMGLQAVIRASRHQAESGCTLTLAARKRPCQVAGAGRTRTGTHLVTGMAERQRMQGGDMGKQQAGAPRGKAESCTRQGRHGH